jgi:ribosomal protein L19
MCYFLQEVYEKELKKRVKFTEKKVACVKGSRAVKFFFVGDVIEIVYFMKNIPIVFEGVCWGIRKKKQLLNSNVTFFLRNVILGVGIEIIASFYLNRLYLSKKQSFKRKMLHVKRSRLFYIRYRLNRESRVK